MIYMDFKGLKLSALGFGTMRLPVKNGVYSDIDEEKVAEMFSYAIAHGVNYFDTAWGYHEGNSEIAVGKALSAYPRDSFYLATKFPGYDLSNMGKVEEIFEAQLKKCGVGYFDFYLIHNVCEMNIDAYLNEEKYGTVTYLKKQRENGRIKYLGFSAHGDLGVMRRFLDAYGKDMEFCQLQINYLDWSFQNAKGKVALLDEWHIPVWVMEPLRGGKLATQPVNEEERAALFGIAAHMTGKTSLPCTACRYCTGHCPKHLDIPEIIRLYNEYSFTGGGFIAPMVLGTMPHEKWPDACIGCRSCEKVCPQQIRISEMMKDFSARLKKGE